MLPARMMRVLFSIWISSIFIEVALGVACEDKWLDYCPKHYNAQHENCKFDGLTRSMCQVTCGLCPSRTTPSTTSTVITSVPSSPSATAGTKATSIPTTSTTALPTTVATTVSPTTTAATTTQQPLTAADTTSTTAITSEGIQPTTASTTGKWPIPLYLYPWTWTDRDANTKKDKGPPCAIPFNFRGHQYDDCIKSHYAPRPWCPYVHDYAWTEVDTRWGYCPECKDFIPSLPSNISLTTKPAGLGKRAIVKAIWKPSSSNEECKFSMKYNIKFTTTDGREEYIVNATDELHSDWPDAPANKLIHVSVQSLNCFNYPCKSSEWSEASSINSSNKYPGAVKNMRVTQRTWTSLTLMWDPHDNDQGIFDYKVSYSGNSISNGYHHEVTLQDLNPGSEYLITVTPRNEIGYGESKSIGAWTDIEVAPEFTVVKRQDNVVTVTWTGLPRSYTKLQIRYCTSDTTPICGNHLIADQNALEASFVVSKFKQKRVVCYLEVYDASDLVYRSPPVESPNEVEEPINWIMYGIGGAVVLLLVVLVGVGILLWRRMARVLGAGDGDVGVSVPQANPAEPLYLNQAFERAESQVDPVYYNVPQGKQTEDAEEEPYEEIPENPYASLDNAPDVVADQPYANLRPSGD